MIPIPTTIDYIRILPLLVLIVSGVVVMMIEPVLPKTNTRRALGFFSVAGVLGAMLATAYQAQHHGTAFSNMVRVDNFSIFFHFVVLLVSLLVLLGSIEYAAVQDIKAGEFYALILFGTVGALLMTQAIELVLIFIGIEISSISTYVLAGFRRRYATSVESALKYFLLGSFATAFFLYGVALMFGATGSTNVYTIGESLRNNTPLMAYVAMALMFVGLGFKVAAAPFHTWTPDVYEGAPSPVTALMATGPKAAMFAVLLRVIFATSAPGWFWLVWVAAVLSMTLGNIGALVQNNIKRMLAYSSIAHAGYLLVAFAATPQIGISAAMFYTLSYAVMNVGAFLVITHLANQHERYVSVDDYAGLAYKSPLLAATLTVFLMSLIGIPFTAGFFAKFYVFAAALKTDLVALTIIGVVNSAIAAYYYLRVIVVMYMRERDETVPVTKVSMASALSLAVAAVATIYLGIFPGDVVSYAARSVEALLR